MNVVIFSDANENPGFGRYAGAYKIATELRLAGYSTQVVEFFADLDLQDIQEIVAKFVDSDTLFVGFATTLFSKKITTDSLSRVDRHDRSRYSGHFPQDRDFVDEMFALIRKRNAGTKIVIGGTKAYHTDLPGVDYWVWGEADRSVVALADYLKHDGPLVRTPGRTGQAISSADYPYDDFDDSKIVWQPCDYLFEGEHLPIETARGCVFRCSFCAQPLHKKPGEYEKSPRALEEELLYNYHHFGTQGYMLCDDTYNDSLEKVASFHRVFDRLPFNIEWTGTGRVDCIYRHPEQRDLLLESGLRTFLFGIETFHPVAAKGIGKGLHPERIKDTLYYLRETWKGKVITTGSFIIGLPGEPEESIWRTVEWLQRDDCPLDDAIFSPLSLRRGADDPNAPISPIALNPERYGYAMPGSESTAGTSSPASEWRGQFMDRSYAEKLARDVEETLLRRHPIGNWVAYSRLRSIGYSHSEVASRHADDAEFLAEAERRRGKMRQEYLNKLLA